MEIRNTTPWNTEDLGNFLRPLAKDCGITSLTINLLEAMPGQAREKQRAAELEVKIRQTAHASPWVPTFSIDGAATLEILSPKRAGARSNPLDRLSVAQDFETHESMLPREAIAVIVHAFDTLRETVKRVQVGGQVDSWNLREHLRGVCKCQKQEVDVTIRGDTTVKTHVGRNNITTDALEKKLKKANNSLTGVRTRLSRAQKAVAKLVAGEAAAAKRIEGMELRLLKLRAKEAMSVPLKKHPEQ